MEIEQQIYDRIAIRREAFKNTNISDEPQELPQKEETKIDEYIKNVLLDLENKIVMENEYVRSIIDGDNSEKRTGIKAFIKRVCKKIWKASASDLLDGQRICNERTIQTLCAVRDMQKIQLELLWSVQIQNEKLVAENDELKRELEVNRVMMAELYRDR